MHIQVQHTEKDYRAVVLIHYKTNRWTIVRPILGFVMVGYTGISFFLLKDYIIGGFCLFFAAYLFSAKWIYVTRAIKTMKTNRHFGSVSEYEFFQDGRIFANSNAGKTEISLKSVIYYVVNKDWILLYFQKNLFIFFKISEIEKNGILNQLKLMLDQFGIPPKSSVKGLK